MSEAWLPYPSQDIWAEGGQWFRKAPEAAAVGGGAVSGDAQPPPPLPLLPPPEGFVTEVAALEVLQVGCTPTLCVMR